MDPIPPPSKIKIRGRGTWAGSMTSSKMVPLVSQDLDIGNCCYEGHVTRVGSASYAREQKSGVGSAFSPYYMHYFHMHAHIGIIILKLLSRKVNHPPTHPTRHAHSPTHPPRHMHIHTHRHTHAHTRARARTQLQPSEHHP